MAIRSEQDKSKNSHGDLSAALVEKFGFTERKSNKICLIRLDFAPEVFTIATYQFIILDEIWIVENQLFTPPSIEWRQYYFFASNPLTSFQLNLIKH